MLNFIIFLIVLCAIFYFFKSLFSLLVDISFVWNIIKPLGFLLFLIAVVIWFLKTFVY